MKFRFLIYRTLLVLFGAGVFFAALPPPANNLTDFDTFLRWNQHHLNPFLFRCFHSLGIGQNWAMFANIEGYHDTWFESEVTFPDGSKLRAPLAHPSTLPLAERFVHVRELFFFETISGQGRRPVLQSVAQWVARTSLQEAHPIAGQSGLKVRLLSRWRPSYVFVDGSQIPYEETEVYQQQFSQEELL